MDLLLLDLEKNGGSAPFKVITPRDPGARGCQLSVLFATSDMMEKVFMRMGLRGVLADERRPSVIRISPAPLYCSFKDVYDTVDSLRDSLLMYGKE